MKHEMRCFISIDLPGELKDQVADLSRRLASVVRGRFVPRANYHLTCAFLGELDEAGVRRAMDAMDKTKVDGNMKLQATGLGKFGKSRDATLWLGILQTEEMDRFVAALRENLTSASLTFDGKPFRAHITLARHARIPHASLPYLDFPGEFSAPTFTLYRSILGKDGAIYKPLYTLPIASRRETRERSQT